MNSSRIVAIVQARTGSTRLPAKVLMSIGEKSMLERVIERIQRMRTIDEIVVATSVSPNDDTIAQICASEGWNCFRGPEQDVLERYLRAAQAWQASDIVRITADCPLFSWQQADRLVAHHIASGGDYTHNLTCWGSGLPLGTGVEALTIDALGMAWTYGLEPHHREHVTEYIYENPRRFKLEMLRAPEHLERPFYRLTVDTLDDLKLVRRIHERVAPSDDVVDLREAIALLDAEPGLASSNIEPGRKAG
jgi:spore coat polysaccharide biosynthesis protein SpsF (cytidylyltransferase family)